MWLVGPRCAVEVRGFSAADLLGPVRAALVDTGLYLPPLQALIALYADASEWLLARPAWAICHADGSARLRQCEEEVRKSAALSPLWKIKRGTKSRRNRELWCSTPVSEVMLEMMGYVDHVQWDPCMQAAVPSRGLPADVSRAVRLAHDSPVVPDRYVPHVGKADIHGAHPSWMSIAEAHPDSNPVWRASLRLEPIPGEYRNYCTWVSSVRWLQREHAIPEAHLRIVFWFGNG